MYSLRGRPLPDVSLGWEIARWAEAKLTFGPGPLRGQPLRLTDEMVRFLVHVYGYEFDRSRGVWRRIYNEAVYSRPKGSSKSGSVGLVVVCAEAFGDCRLDYVDKNGRPHGKPITSPFIRLTATELLQAQSTVYGAVKATLEDSPLQHEVPGLDVGKMRTEWHGGEIRPSTSGSASKDGGLETFSGADEAHLLDTPELRDMFDTVHRNTFKRSEDEPWVCSFTTAHAVGARSVAEAKYRDWKAGVKRLLYDVREGPQPNEVDWDDPKSIHAALVEAFGDVTWVDLWDLVDEATKPSTDLPTFGRYWLNVPSVAANKWIKPTQYDALPSVDSIADGESVAIGFDGSEGTETVEYIADSTAIVGCRMSDGALFKIGVWEQPGKGPWKPPRLEVRDKIREVVGRLHVTRLYGDPKGWATDLDEMAAEFGDVKVAPWATSSQRSRQNSAAIKRLEIAIKEGSQPIVPDDDLRRHILNAVKHTQNSGGDEIARLAKPSDEDKIDLAVAAYLAREARDDAYAKNEGRSKNRRRGSFVTVGRR